MIETNADLERWRGQTDQRLLSLEEAQKDSDTITALLSKQISDMRVELAKVTTRVALAASGVAAIAATASALIVKHL